VTRWQAFNALCSYLRAALLNDGPRPDYGEIPWELLIEISSHHYVTPALAWVTIGNPDIPSDVRDYLDAILALSSKRNEMLLNDLERIVRKLNTIGIVPVPIKGLAHLIGGLYPARGFRAIGDIDVLIPKERAKEAVSALENLGYAITQTLPETHQHLPQMRHVETGSGNCPGRC
jgi:hypothetical protein